MGGNIYDPNSPTPSPTPVPAPPAPEPIHPVTPHTLYDVDRIKRTIDLALKVADTAAHMIPGDVDDRILAVIKQLAAQDWFADIVTMLLNMTSAQREATIKGMGRHFERN